jgi:hypothetical protein
MPCASRGLTSHDIARLCRAGTLHQLVRGWFATRPPHDRVDRHLLTSRAPTQHFDGRAVPSHHSRLLALGLPVWRADLSVVHLTRVQDRGSRRRAGFTVKEREDAIRDEQFEVVRVVWRQLGDPAGIHRRIVDAVARCSRRAA